MRQRRPLTKEQKAEIDRLACDLYDKLNPELDGKISVSKAECIRRVMQERK